MSRLSRICDVSPDCRDRFKDFRDLKVLKQNQRHPVWAALMYFEPD